MASAQPIRAVSNDPISLHTHAMENLRFIRDSMERAGSFTGVPGWGGVAMGLSALVAAAIATAQSGTVAWLMVWLVEALVAMAIGAFALVRKARSEQLSLASAPGGELALSHARTIRI